MLPEEEFERIKDVMPRWHMQKFNEKKNVWEVSPVADPEANLFFLPMFRTKMHADTFLLQLGINKHGFHDRQSRVACIDSAKCLSWFCAEVDYLENELSKRTGKLSAVILPIVVDYKYLTDPFREQGKDIAFNSFRELLSDCMNRVKEKTVEVAPRYFLYNDTRKEPNICVGEDVKIVCILFFTCREYAEKAKDWLHNHSEYSKCALSVHSIGGDFTSFEYNNALIKALTDLPLTLRDLLDLPEKPDFWDAMRMPVIVDCDIGFDKIEVPTLTLKDLVVKFPEVYGVYLGRPEIEYYKGYTIFMHMDTNKQAGGMACRGEFVSYEQVKIRDVCFQDYVGEKIDVLRRIKAWIDRQSIIDEKNQRKAERKAQREEQAEANKPFRWFVPHKFAGRVVSGAIENDGTIVKKSSEETSDFVTISNTIGDLWNALGNRRWFVNGDIVKFIKHANVPDTRMDGLFFPYDAFYVIFENSPDPERRFMIRNHTIQYLRVVRVKSEQACKLIDDSMVTLFMPYKCVISIVTSTDNSKEVFEGAVFIDIADSSKIPEGVGSAEEKAQIQRIVVALLLLYSGRVEIFKKYTIPRSQRYELNKGIKDQHKDNNEVITMMPLKKLVVEDPKPSDGTGQKRKTHMRGWCLDTLRHPRYRRNPDGTLRTRIRPPCIINDPQKEV
jgi:hypothetical protein